MKHIRKDKRLLTNLLRLKQMRSCFAGKKEEAVAQGRHPMRRPEKLAV